MLYVPECTTPPEAQLLSTSLRSHLWKRSAAALEDSGLLVRNHDPAPCLPTAAWSEMPTRIWHRTARITGNEILGKLWALLLLTFSLSGMLPLLHMKYLPGKIQRSRSLSELCPNTPSFSVLPKETSLAKNTALKPEPLSLQGLQ